MVKSANDMAVVIAEGVAGSIESFSGEMNQTALRLGMTQTSYVNPNGLPAEGQITSARDMAMLARAIIRDMPEYEYFTHTPGDPLRPAGHAQLQQADRPLSRRRRHEDRLHLRLRLQSRRLRHAQRQADDRGRARRAVVAGARGAKPRSCSSAALPATRLTWLRPSLGTRRLWSRSPPSRRTCATTCAARSASGPATDDDADTVASNGSASSRRHPLHASSPPGCRRDGKPSEMLAAAPAPSEPMVVYTGPKSTGAALVAAVAADEQKPDGERGKEVAVAAKKPDAAAETQAGRSQGNRSQRSQVAKPTAEAKPAAKPADRRQAHAEARRRHQGRRKAEAGSRQARGQAGRCPQAAARQPAQPAKPKAAEKPAKAKPAAKPAPKSSAAKPSDAKPCRRRRLRAAKHRLRTVGPAILNRQCGDSAQPLAIMPPHCSILPQNKASRFWSRTGNKSEGKNHGSHLAQEISGRRARRHRRQPVHLAGRRCSRRASRSSPTARRSSAWTRRSAIASSTRCRPRSAPTCRARA